MKRKIRDLLLTATLIGTAGTVLTSVVADTATAATRQTDKRTRLRKLQKLNRAYQVCYGRSLKRQESAEVLNLTEAQLVQKIIASNELSKVYADRLAEFAGRADSAAHSEVTDRLSALARPTEKLDVVLGAIDRDRHKGEQCGDKSNSLCFATWLVGRVAPSLGYGWVKERAASMPSWTYARLLEEIAKSSINQ